MRRKIFLVRETLSGNWRRLLHFPVLPGAPQIEWMPAKNGNRKGGEGEEREGGGQRTGQVLHHHCLDSPPRLPRLGPGSCWWTSCRCVTRHNSWPAPEQLEHQFPAKTAVPPHRRSCKLPSSTRQKQFLANSDHFQGLDSTTSSAPQIIRLNIKTRRNLYKVVEPATGCEAYTVNLPRNSCLLPSTHFSPGTPPPHHNDRKPEGNHHHHENHHPIKNLIVGNWGVPPRPPLMESP